jgi:hypothetical protein
LVQVFLRWERWLSLRCASSSRQPR